MNVYPLRAIMILGLAVHSVTAQEEAIDPDRIANTVILDETGVANLGIETVEVLETDFEESFFAVGRIESIPARRAVVSTRIPGRIVDLLVHEGDSVEEGQKVATVESLQPGNPPPRIDLKAPLSGLIMESHILLGEPIEPSADLLDITDLSEVYAVARVPEDQAGLLKLGTKAHIRVAAIPDEEFEGEMLRFGTAADEESGTIDALFRLPNESGKLRPGMRSEFSIVTGMREWVMAVPKASLQGDPANRFVYVRDFELPHAFVKAPVQTGTQNDRFVEIINGLFPGDEVVTTGAYALSYAGGGSISLKEALDAAHGHEHNDDGSEMTPEQKADQAREAAAAAGGGRSNGPLTLFFMLTSLLFLVLLFLTSFRRPRPAENPGTAS